MNRFTVRSGEMDFAWWEQGSGKATLFLHGFTGSKENWARLGQRLAGERHVLAVDLPGHGESGIPDDVQQYSMPRVGRCLEDMLNQLGIGSLDVVGYSMGGRLGLYFTLYYPDKVSSLVLESSSPGLKTKEERQLRCQADETLADRIESKGVEEFVNDWERLPLFASQARLCATFRSELRRQRLKNSAGGLANSLRGMGSGVQPSLWERLGEISLPVMLITGALDEKFVQINQKMKSKMAGAHLEVVTEAGHSVHLEQPELYEKILRNFWEGLECRGEKLTIG